MTPALPTGATARKGWKLARVEASCGRPVPLMLHGWLCQGVGTREMASRLGVTPRTVRNWLRAYGLVAGHGSHGTGRRRRACTPRKLAQVEAYYGRPAAVLLHEWRSKGKSVEVIAGLCGVGRSTAYRWLARLGLLEPVRQDGAS